jgi:hypothetical protein
MLEESLSGDDCAFDRFLNAGLMCEHHHQNERAAHYYGLMLSVCDSETNAGRQINPAFREQMRSHVDKLRVRGSVNGA